MITDEKLKEVIAKILKIEYDNEKNNVYSDESMIKKIIKIIEDMSREINNN